MSRNECIEAARDYMTRLGWVLVPVRGPGARKPKAPFHGGWPECRPTWADLAELLALHPKAGVAVNLGASRLVDVEADTPEGESLLDELCGGATFPWWQSVRGKHRLFSDDGRVSYVKAEGGLKIEFRAGGHISILPPSLHASGRVRYAWGVSPFDVPPPPLPEPLYRLYLAHPPQDGPEPARRGEGRPRARPFPFRDDLDFVLRHFDLMGRAAQAGVEFVYRRPDANGNVPCHVPEALRGGDPDESPSGVFNVRSGRLRDFATGENHRYFDVIAALTGRTWNEVFHDHEREAGARGRRPHSRRVCLPGPPDGRPVRMELGEARAELRDYYREQLSRPPVPRQLHVIQGPPGVGKTYLLCEELARLNKKATLLTMENRLAQVHAELMAGHGSERARRMPILRQTGCPSPDEYLRVARLGYDPKNSRPCLTCPVGKGRCEYLIGFSTLADADQLCCAGVYHTHEGFYASYGNESRPLLVFDENPVDLLLAPEAHTVGQWLAWARLLRSPYRRSHRPVPRKVRRIRAFVRWLRDTATEFVKDEAGHKPFAIPAAFKVVGPLNRVPTLDGWFAEVARERDDAPPNLFGAAAYLLTQQDSWLLLEKDRRRGSPRNSVIVRFRRRHPLPEDREVFLLDATASVDLIRAIVPDWSVKVWQCPPVAQAGRVVQVMDYHVSRAFVRREVRRHQPLAPCWLAQVLDGILAGARSAALVAFKPVATDRHREYDILGRIAHGGKIRRRLHFPCRGIGVEEDTLIVLGTPYKSEATVLELALAVYGMEGLPRGEYGWQMRQEGQFVAWNMGYRDERLQAIQRFLVSADLTQAVGRVRPLQRDVTVYVVSNAPVPDWEVTQVCAAELFDLRRPLRRDAAENYQRYAQELTRCLDAGGWVGNGDVCRALGMNRRSGWNHRARFKEEHRDRLQAKGHRIAWRGDGDGDQQQNICGGGGDAESSVNKI